MPRRTVTARLAACGQRGVWGLYDMHGNVWEWCSDWHGRYPSWSVTDPAGSSSDSYRVIRRGSWATVALSGENVVHDLSMDIREAEITARMSEGEFFMIDPHEVENGCVQIVNVHWLLRRTHTKVVGCAVCHTAFDTAPGHSHREAVVIVVAPHRDTGAVGRRGPPELATPKDEGVLE